WPTCSSFSRASISWSGWSPAHRCWPTGMTSTPAGTYRRGALSAARRSKVSRTAEWAVTLCSARPAGVSVSVTCPAIELEEAHGYGRDTAERVSADHGREGRRLRAQELGLAGHLRPGLLRDRTVPGRRPAARPGPVRDGAGRGHAAAGRPDDRGGPGG